MTQMPELMPLIHSLAGPSSAILSHIMCKAMSRNFINVGAGGFGTSSSSAAAATAGDHARTVEELPLPSSTFRDRLALHDST